MKYSFIVPVFNRPDEVDELLESLTRQTITDFEVIVVEDGSAVPCHDVCEKYRGLLNLHYYYKENSGPGQSRNYGVERAKGDYVLILDSDVVVPPGYLQAVEDELNANDADAFGGPDAAHPSFTPKHDGRNTRWKEENGQVLPAFVQHGRASQCVFAAWRVLEDALWRRHRLLDTYL